MLSAHRMPFRFLSAMSTVLVFVFGLITVTAAQTSGVLREYWSGVTGTSVSNLTSNVNYPNVPTSRTILTSFEGPANVADNYGSRIRGYVIPPTTGSYTFWIASDDNSELWLSTSADPASKTLVASVTGYTNSREWTKFSSQQSTARTLTAGQKYYIEVLHKDGTGGDNIAVGWQGPGITGDVERPIPGSRLVPYEAGLTREVWTGISGTAVSNLTSSVNYPNSPNLSETIYTFEAPANYADNYGTRIRGFVVPPTTGSYTFWIASDDNSELWLSTSADPVAKTLIASVSDWTNSREWTKYSTQQSAARTLTAGQKYYIEVLHKDATGGDNVAVGWQGPGITGDVERPIPASRLLAWTGGYSLTVNNDGHGTTSPSGTVTVGSGTATSISATPANGYQFSNWSVTSGTATIANPSAASTTVTLTSGNAAIQANFSAVAYSLTITNDGHGTTSPTGTVTVASGAATSISANPAVGYQFLNWTVTSGSATIASPSSPATTVTLTSGNATIRANFSVVAYSLVLTNDGHGTTSPTGTVIVDYGVATAILATPASGYQFLNWTVTSGSATIASSTSASTTVTLTSGNATIRANFSITAVNLTVANDGHGTTTPSGTVQVTPGVAQSIGASPASGYQFLNWTVTSGTATIANPNSASTTVTISAAATVRANFTPLTFTLTMASDGHGTTTPTGAVSVEYAIAQSISATPASGYSFLNWTVTAGSATITDVANAVTTVTLTSGNATVRANFTSVTYTLTVGSDGNGTTTPAGSVTVSHGVAQAISATPSSGYAFNNWSIVTGSPVIANTAAAVTTVTLGTGNGSIRANFIVAQPGQPNNRQIAISGTLADAAGNPVGSPSPVTIAVQVNIVPVAAGGTPLYTETFLPQNGKGITVENGRFVVTLGTGAATGDLTAVLAANANCFAEITILGETPDVLLPRTPITASPYALGVSPLSNELHANGYPADLNIVAKIGTYYVNDEDGSTWVRVQNGWKQID